MTGTAIDTPQYRGLALLVARIGMASLFLFSGLEKCFDYGGAIGFAGMFGIPFARYLMPIAILIELGCGAALLTRRYCRPAAAILTLWVLGLNLWFHHFWAVPPEQWQNAIDGFFHHFVMAGGLIYVAVFGAGPRDRLAPL